MAEAPAVGGNTGSNGGRAPRAPRNGAGDHKEPTTGRRGKEGQEAKLDAKVVAEALPGLEQAARASQAASEKYSKLVKKVSQDSGFNAANVRALIAARIGDKVDMKRRDAEQQCELFKTTEDE